jgi:2-methylcitrate dehydratase PrpD
MMAGLRELATAVAALRFETAPEAVRDRVQDLVTDTLAVTSWGARRTELAAVRDLTVIGNVPSATILGTSASGPSALAAALNGSAVAADQLQDGHRLARGHPGSHVVLAVFALAEERDASIEDMLSAVLAGYEAGVRVGRAMGGTPPGVHDIGTWGALAAAVGTAYLLRPGDASTVARTIELAGSAPLLTDAATVFGGHTGGHAYLGASVAHGLWLGQAGAAGLSAAPGALERFFAAHAAADWTGLAAEHGGYEILGGYLKLHPACAHLHGMLDALDDLRGQVDHSDVDRVEVRTYAAAATFSAAATSELQARFSIPTAAALTLHHGGLTHDVLTDEQVRSDAVRALAERVEVVHDPVLDAGYPDGRPATVEITLRGGRTVAATSIRPRGDADAPRQAFRSKAEGLLRDTFGRGAGPLLDVIGRWPAPRELGAAFRAAGADRG